jgi:F0F1-type ATP synthase assembly protein I
VYKSRGQEPAFMPSELPPAEPAKDGSLRSLASIQNLIQLGLLLPACVVIGWACGLALDRWLDKHWINVVGLIVGVIAGFAQTVRVALSHMKD